MPGKAGRAMRGKRRYMAFVFPVFLIAAVAGMLLQRSDAAATTLGTSNTKAAQDSD